jgi:hypothetical protein
LPSSAHLGADRLPMAIAARTLAAARGRPIDNALVRKEGESQRVAFAKIDASADVRILLLTWRLSRQQR